MHNDPNTEDKRVALPEGYELTIFDKDTDSRNINSCKITIQKKISSGGSCLVYQGIQSKSVDAEKVTWDVIVKEFYPKKLDEKITRTKGLFKLKFVDEETKNEYEQELSRFCKGQAKHILFASKNSENALPPPLCSGISKKTGAYYSVSLMASGKVLSDVDLDEYSIIDALELSISICEAIGKVHKGKDIKDKQGRVIENYPCSCGLYLDLKPDNIFVLNNKAYLFDFDTLQPKGGIRFSSYSKGYSAPEQELVSGIGYKDTSKIGYHTDIFSIGAVLCYLLTGKNPYEIGLEAIKKGFEWKASIRLKDTTKALTDDGFIQELDKLMISILDKQPDERKSWYGSIDATEDLTRKLEELKDKAISATILKEVKNLNIVLEERHNDLKEGIENNEGVLFDIYSKVIGIESIVKGLDKLSEQLAVFSEEKPIISRNEDEMDGLFDKLTIAYKNVKNTGKHKKSTHHRQEVYYFENGTYYIGEWKEGYQNGLGTLYYDDDSICYEGKWAGGKRNGLGSFYVNNLLYEGKWKDDKRNGLGTLYLKDGTVIYKGEWKDDKYNGKGTYYYDEGYYYEGEWKDNKRHGEGILYYPNGSVKYTGEWKDNHQNGQGTYYYEDGSVWYEGEVKENQTNGRGIYHFKDGFYLEGEFKKQKVNGKGTIYRKDGSIEYEGEWKDGKRHGKGIIYYPNGSVKYRGEWKDDCLNGKGTYYYDEGYSYEGEWKDNKRHGEGVIYYPNGSVKYRGEWKDNHPNGQGTYYYENGSVWYEGEVKENQTNGRGIYHFTDGSYLEGEFKEQKANGKGTIYRKNGSIVYEGGFIDGKFNGHGILYKPDGTIEYEGEWKDDKRVE